MHLLILVLIIALLLRFVYRFVIDFPRYPGRSPLQGTDTHALMDEDEFWGMIAESRQISRGNYDAQVEVLTDLLERRSLNDIIAFNNAFEALMNRVDDFRYWEAVYALNWGCSDDMFDYFRSWWIGQGKNKFYWTVRFPRLFFFFAVRDIMQNYEGLQYCAADAYKNLNGRDIPPPEIEYTETRGKKFNEGLAVLKYPELAFLAW